MRHIIDALPHICGNEEAVKRHTGLKRNFYSSISNIVLDKVGSAFGIALHMHQPTIPASTDNLEKASLISNLQYMLEHPHIHDNHNAPIFLKCYSRISDFIRELVGDGHNPRVMLDYSGNLLWGLSQMGRHDVLENLKLVTQNKEYHQYVEWLGTAWSHSAVSSTPVPDVELHVRAWQEHFASIFGYPALERVKGFSAPEMHLPIHPDVCHEYIKTLKKCGYEWLMVQEHTIENIDASPIKMPYFPHRLIAKNSLAEIEELTVLIKTQGSDTKLVGQMQPYYEAKTKHRENYCGKNIPPFVLQISDGENGGVMMNEFPDAYKRAFREVGMVGAVGMNGTEYLEFVKEAGLNKEDFIPVQPVLQHRVWEFVESPSPGASDRAIEKAKQKYGGFNLDKGSWTNDKSWVKGYEHILDPINSLSVAFHRKFDGKKVDKRNRVYQEALLYLLLSHTSCFRFWGEGLWTNYAKEIVKRGMDVLS